MINATLSYGRYLAQMIWPLNLSFYPLPQVFPIWPAVGVGLGLLAASLFALWTVRTRPYVAFGWSWYLVTLLPVIGLLQVGRMSHADRYTYIPSIGVVALLVWGAHDLTRRCRYQFLILSALAVAATLPCIALTRRQLSYWKDSESQVRHALEVTTNNDAAHSGLGLLLVRKGLLDEAIREFEITIRLNPGFAEAHYDLGIVLALKGQLDEAVHQFQEALRLKPQYVEAHNNLGIALFRKGQMEGAIREFEEAIRLNPAFAEGHCNLGLAVGKTGRADEAIGHFEAALQANRDYPEAHNYLGMVLCQRGRTSEGLRHFQEALRLKPGYAEARKNLDAVLAAQSNTPPPTSPESRP
jgi:tetratricopeptide (TPR) repeat protein